MKPKHRMTPGPDGKIHFSAAWWLRMSSRQMLHGLQCHWNFPYTMWMVKLCAKEHMED